MAATKEMTQALEQLERAKDECMKAVKIAIGDICRRHQITAEFYYLTTLKDKNGNDENVSKDVADQISEIEAWYSEHVHRSGFMYLECVRGKWNE